jgi:pimeloyl-ACP methyl ester carboxylesterase
MPKVKANDIQIYYEVRGEGFPLVMIHRLGANLDWWEPRMGDERHESDRFGQSEFILSLFSSPATGWCY